MPRPRSSPAIRGQHATTLPKAVSAEEESQEALDATTTTIMAASGPLATSAPLTDVESVPESATPPSGLFSKPRPLNLASASAALAASIGILDLSSPSTSARGGGGVCFADNFRQVVIEGTKARGRYLTTKQQLDRVRHERRNIEASRFSEDVQSIKAEVTLLLGELDVECQSMHEVAMETQDISKQVDELMDNDSRMGALLEKMNRKLDDFQQTLGNF